MVQAILSYIARFDSWGIYAVQSLGPQWEPVARVLSYGIGSYFVLLAAFVIALVLIEKWRVALELIIVALVGFAVVWGLKTWFQVDRPYMIDTNIVAYDEEDGFGLPSGHAAMSVIILGWIAMRHPRTRTIVWGSIALIILISLSRLYLGVHYPSQVVAGWLVGVLVLYLARVVDRRLWPPVEKKLRKR